MRGIRQSDDALRDGCMTHGPNLSAFRGFREAGTTGAEDLSHMSNAAIAAPTEEALALHMHLVHRIVAHFMRRLPRSVQREDLVAAGTLGLFHALRSTTHTCAEMFEGYARIRIRGAIVDELRRHDWSPRRRREPAEVAPEETSKGTRPLPNGGSLRALPSPTDNAQPVDQRATPDAPDASASAAPPSPTRSAKPRFRISVVGFDDLPPHFTAALEEERESPLDEVEFKWTSEKLYEAIAQLPDRERMIIQMRYFDGLPSKVIASTLGLSEARISQLHARATARLKALLAESRDGFDLAA